MLSKRNKRKQAKRHGFLARMKTKGGQKIIKRQRSRHRQKMGVR